VPAWEGAHQDHDAANVLGARLRDRCAVFEFAEYNFAGSQVNAGMFPADNGTERRTMLTPEECRWKESLLGIYRSERGNLAHCRAPCETLRPLAAYDYAVPPHPGRLFRERFHWVPLKHPRIDFEPSAAVRATLAAWIPRDAEAQREGATGDAAA
jgi:hypothetical protein